MTGSARQPLALVTGASSGIGAEIARVLAESGYDLVLCARREEQLNAVAKPLRELVQVHVVALDLGKSKGVAKLLANLQSYHLNVDVLVNNAGAANTGRLDRVPRRAALDMVNLNVRAVTELTHGLLPGMIERGRGHFLNVASVAGFHAVPGMAVYSATKAFVLSFSESLSEELVGTGVTATALCPGLTRTGMAYDFGSLEVADCVMSQPADVATAGVRAMLKGDAVSVPGIANRALLQWARYQPRSVVRFFSGLLGRSVFN